MTLDRSRRTTFNDAARLYDEVRPGYPDQLVEDVIALSGILPDGRILEIGCGPGKATLPFARRGYAMLCLELGPDLAALAAENCRPYPRVEVRCTAFEDWPVETAAFDLVISAQAFHWIPPEVGYARAAEALKDTGAIALFWNYYPGSDTPLIQALDEVYRARAPQLALDDKGGLFQEELVEKTLADFAASGCFGEVMLRRYPWSKQYTADQYVKLLQTYSDHRSLDEETLRYLCAGVRETIEQRGGTVERPYLSVLYIAHKQCDQRRENVHHK
ncbi:MAG: class I SAM-dependent methyltransferase [Chloroflexi bacterium]|nr:class I SAM-dependent methyltransferase [Chloroflexota bacterium]MBU1750811.1 class I SAM-dependent methyltransferase [Chloroflexota bacterium]